MTPGYFCASCHLMCLRPPGLSWMQVDQSFWQSAIAAKPTAAAKVRNIPFASNFQHVMAHMQLYSGARLHNRKDRGWHLPQGVYSICNCAGPSPLRLLSWNRTIQIQIQNCLCSVEENMRFADTRPGTLQGYFLASFLFMAIVFSLPICLGLAALALDLPVSTLNYFHIPSSVKSILHTPCQSADRVRCSRHSGQARGLP